VREWLWLARVTRQLGDSANHRYILLGAAGRMRATRRSSTTFHGPIPNQGPTWAISSP